jgi:hypothetical protein
LPTSDTRHIGLLFTLNGIMATFCQFIIFPPVARRFGVLFTLKVVSHVLPVVYLLVPFTVLIENRTVAEICLVAAWLTKSILTICAYPCCTILLANSVSSAKVLGTVNGITTSVGAVGRAIGPMAAGIAFTWGAKSRYLMAPFWVLGFMSLAACSPLYFVVEGDGFGNDDDEEEDPDSDSDSGSHYLSDEAEEPEDELAPLIQREQEAVSAISHSSAVSSNVVTNADDK